MPAEVLEVSFAIDWEFDRAGVGTSASIGYTNVKGCKKHNKARSAGMLSGQVQTWVWVV